ncbi:MAG TPA: hypothetical protein VGC18_12570 [Lacisediminihabitans sp.]|uniref:hypothetical protein n=1 Tax=Lacisediminihabitans sp. TaxID=2787631 RepID=UPI002EDB5522
MRILRQRTVMAVTLLMLALSVAHGGSTSLIVASIATVAIASAIAVRYAAIVVSSRELNVGERAHAHREVMNRMPAPQHPSTAGRPRTRAPSRPIPAA